VKSTSFLATVVGVGVWVSTAGAAASPPDAMFRSGYDKCKLVTIGALGKTAGKKLAKARFDGKICTWSSGDGSVTILVDTHPAGYLELLGPSLGRHANGDVAKLIVVPGASKAVLETFSHANTGRYAKDILAVYPQGVVQVSLNYATAVTDKTAIALVRLLTHT
jgi:hypothetical protein